MLGNRSVPPAMSMARGPSPARIFAASATERGARCSNHGSLSIALELVAVATLPGRQDEGRFRIGDGRKAFRPNASIFLLKSFKYFVRRDRNLVDAHTDRV